MVLRGFEDAAQGKKQFWKREGRWGAASGSDSSDRSLSAPKVVADTFCVEKHGKIMEPVEKLKSGMRLNKVAAHYSEDKVMWVG